MRRPRMVVALAAALLVVGGLGSPADAQPVGPPAGLDERVGAELLAARGGEARAAYRDPAPLRTLVEVKRRSADGRWAFGGAVILVPATVAAGPITALFVAQWTGGRWAVTFEGTPGFGDGAPSSVVEADERRLLGVTARAAEAPVGLSLPWQKGQGWAHWGVHGNSGTSRPYNSIDFYGGDGQVRTSRAGKMYRFCTSGGRWPFIKVVHDNGWTTGYYHLRNTTTKADGAAVALGEFMGQIGEELPCGGSANGNHVHWTLWSGNTAVAVQGKTIGGWTWYEGSSAYNGYAERGGTRVFRSNCCPLVNYGGGETGKYFENPTDVPINDNATAESSITVSGVPDAASFTVSINVDIKHTWRGDLVLDVVLPDGTVRRVADFADNDSADNVTATYTLTESGKSANGTWKLRATDIARNDTGRIDVWGLTF